MRNHLLELREDEKLVEVTEEGDTLTAFKRRSEADDDIEEDQFKIDGYKASFNSAGNGKGVVGFYKADVFTHRADCKLQAAQLSLFESEAVDVIHIYRSQQQRLGEVLEKVREWKKQGDNRLEHLPEEGS